MRRKSNKIQFFALVFVMLFSVVNAWGIELLRKETLYSVANKNLRVVKEGSSCSWTQPADGSNDPCHYEWTASTNNLCRFEALTWNNSRNISDKSYIVVKTKNLTGKYRIVVRSKINNEEHTFVYGDISAAGVVKVPLNNRNRWTEKYTQINENTFTEMKKSVTSISIGGFSDNGSLDFMEIALATRIRDVYWDAAGHIELTNDYFPVSQDQMTRNGDYFENKGTWCGLTLSFDTELATSSFYVDGEYYGSDGQKTITPNPSFLNNFVAMDCDGIHYKPNALRAYIPHSKMTDFQVLFRESGAMHIYKVFIRRNDVRVVTFDSDGGTDCNMQETVGDRRITLPTPQKSGCTFEGWYDQNGNKVGNGGATFKPIDRSDGVIELKAKWNTIDVDGTNANAFTVFSEEYSIANGKQQEFTFLTNGNSNGLGWALSAKKTLNDKHDYFFLDLSQSPSVKTYDADAETPGLGEPIDMNVYVKDGNELVALSTDEQWQQFRDDISSNCYVSVKVANNDGLVSVYSVMKKDTRTYVYSFRHIKDDNDDHAINVKFTVDHAKLVRFAAKNSVTVRTVSAKVTYNPTNTEDKFKTCRVLIATLEEYAIPDNSFVGDGDTIMFHAIPGRKWEFEKWSSDVTEPDRQLVVNNTNRILEAIFKRSSVVFNPTQDRIFFEDFEHLNESRNGNIGIEAVTTEQQKKQYEKTPEKTPEGEDYSYMQGKYLNYGGRGRILNDSDPAFGKYYQNLAVGTDEYSKSIAENFLRIILTDGQKNELNGIKFALSSNDIPYVKENAGATIGFWVNARLANKYELPLERGSMFCMFSNERFRKADAGKEDSFEQPRFMFDIACNGWAYSYMPNRPENGEQTENRFFYGDVVAVSDKPTPSLFGKYYDNAQHQAKHKFYDDNQWHYVTYVATNNLKTVTLYIDGNECESMDMTKLDSKYQYFDKDGDYPGRAFYLRNIVLGGFTPHGLFFEKQYYSDAALAYDDVAIYSRALTSDEICDIIDYKNGVQREWHFSEALKADGLSNKTLTGIWNGGNGKEFTLNTRLNKAPLVSGSEVISSTEGLTFSAASGQIVIDQKNGLIGLKRGAQVFIPNVPQYYNVYFVAKSLNSSYPIDHYDIAPVTAATYYTRGVSKYGGNDKDDMGLLVAYHYRNDSPCGFKIYNYGNNSHNRNTNTNTLWFSDIIVSPYCLVYAVQNTRLNNFLDVKNLTYVEAEQNANGKWVIKRNDGVTTTQDNNQDVNAILPKLIVHKGNKSGTEEIANYSQGNSAGNPYLRFSSSAPRVAYVDQQGNVTLTGLAGYATIKAELVFNNLHDGCISTAYEIRVKKPSATKQVVNGASDYAVGNKFTVRGVDGNSDAITMTMGGWTFNDNKYKGSAGDSNLGQDNMIQDAWTNGYGFLNVNDVETIDGYSTASQSKQNAKSETYMKEVTKTSFDDGQFHADNVWELNKTPWTLPCRGSYLKFEPEKTGVLTVYVLQNGNLYKENNSDNYSSHLAWRPVYIADETGKVVDFVKYATNSKISENDNFFKEGRRRAQFIKAEDGTYNQKLINDLKGLSDDRFNRLLEYWENAGWKQKVIPTGDGGYMVMSKGIVRYSFNVYAGKTYYVFSNHTKIEYSGYNFEEGKLLNENDDQYETNPVKPASIQTTTQVYNDVLGTPTLPTGKDCVPVTYNRNFTPGKWGSICLPFSMNNKQMKENFGDETSVVLLKGIDEKGVVQMVWHVNQDIIAGYPYFILPRGKESITQIKTNAYFDPTVKAPSFVIGPEMDNGQSATYGSIELLEKAVGKTEYPYVFKGNFATEQATAGSYVMTTSGVLTKASNTPNIKPFRAYLRYCSQIDASSGDHANGKPLTGMGYMNSDGEEVTTSIEQILEANGIFVDSANVYGIDGQVKRYNTHDLNGLPKGIYIVNGKKYVVK